MKLSTTLLSTIACFTMTSVFAQPGSLDQSFNSNGVVTTSYFDDSDGEAIIEQADGKIVLVGTSSSGVSQSLRAVRYESDGQIDTGFGSSGSVLLSTTTSVGRAVVIQPDGKILVAGSAIGVVDNDMMVARLNSDGTFDTSFGTNGIMIFDIGNDDNLCESMVLQSDGKIVLGGSAFNGSDADMLIIRLNADGTLDTSFGTAGSVFIDANNADNSGESIQLQTDGKIVLAGTQFINGSGDYMVTRVNANGTMDASFGSNGVVITDVLLGNNEASGCAIQADGKIIVHGGAEITIGPTSSFDFCTIRYNTDGTVDTGFGTTGGIVTTEMGNEGQAVGTSVAIAADGRIIVAGDAFQNGVSEIAMARYLEDGTLDPIFGNGGKVQTAVGSDEDLCNAIALQADGRILLAGESDSGNGDSEFVVARYFGEILSICDCTINPELLVFPNPINASTEVTYTLNSDETVSIELYQMDGKLVQTIVKDEFQKLGEYTYPLNNASELTAGMYHLVITVDSWVRTIELVR